MLPPGACRTSPASARRIVSCKGLCADSLCPQIPHAPAPTFGDFQVLSPLNPAQIRARIIGFGDSKPSNSDCKTCLGQVKNCNLSNPSSTWQPEQSKSIFVRKLEKAVAVRNSLLEKFSGKFRRCWKIPNRFSSRHEMLSLPRFGHFPARKTAAGKLAAPSGTLLDSSETATAFLSSSDFDVPSLSPNLRHI